MHPKSYQKASKINAKRFPNRFRMALLADVGRLTRRLGDIPQEVSIDNRPTSLDFFILEETLGGLWGSPGAAKTLHFHVRGVQNQTLGYMDDEIVLRSSSEQVLGRFW